MNNPPSELNSQPAAVYHQWAETASMLSRAFEKEVDEAFLNLLLQAAPDLVHWAQSQGQEDLKQAARSLSNFLELAAIKENQPALIEQMAVEFASLFYGVGVNPVNVIEFVYLGEEHILFEKPYFEVIEFYQGWEYAKPHSSNEPEDHIANELDFLGFMLRSAAWALEKGDAAEFQQRLAGATKFLAEHLNRWAFDLSSAMLKASQDPFYLSMAYFTSGLLKQLAGN